MAKRRSSTAEVVDTVLGVTGPARRNWTPSRRALRALAFGAGGLGGLVAASAGISAFRRRREESSDGS
jgi:hypothetical protein